MLELKYHKMYDDVQDLEFATEESACFDLRAYLVPGTLLKTWNNNNKEYDKPVFRYTSVCTDDLNKDKDGLGYIIMYPGERVLIPTGIKLIIPEGYSVRIHPRSSVSIKRGLSNPNHEGVIDSDYFKECHIVLENTTDKSIENIWHGDRVLQAEMVPVLKYDLCVTDEEPIQRTSRTGGFGSTGVN